MSWHLAVHAMTDGVRQQASVTPAGAKPGLLTLTVYDDAFASIDLTPTQARDLAAILTACANEIEGEAND